MSNAQAVWCKGFKGKGDQGKGNAKGRKGGQRGRHPETQCQYRSSAVQGRAVYSSVHSQTEAKIIMHREVQTSPAPPLMRSQINEDRGKSQQHQKEKKRTTSSTRGCGETHTQATTIGEVSAKVKRTSSERRRYRRRVLEESTVVF